MGENCQEDFENDEVLHGPFAVQQFKDWLNQGHYVADIIRRGRDGDLLPLTSLVRKDQGIYYTRAEFVKHFGGTDEWDAAG